MGNVPFISLYKALNKAPRSRRFVRILIIINLAGSLYGFMWYRQQLATTPLRYWIVVPDSPLSVLAFTAVLVGLYLGRRFRILEAIAYSSMIKYGIWTMFVFLHAWWVRGAGSFEEVHLFASHAGMALEAILFLRTYYPGKTYFAAALAWNSFNDYMDYIVGLHPALPLKEALNAVKWFSLLSTFGTYAFAVTLAVGLRCNSHQSR